MLWFSVVRNPAANLEYIRMQQVNIIKEQNNKSSKTILRLLVAVCFVNSCLYKEAVLSANTKCHLRCFILAQMSTKNKYTALTWKMCFKYPGKRWANARLVWVCQCFSCAASLAAGQIVTLTFVCFSSQTVQHLNSRAAEARCSAAALCANFYRQFSSRHNSPPQSSKITTELCLFYFFPSGKVCRERKLPTLGLFFASWVH